jgi:ATP-dependent DNA ligase
MAASEFAIAPPIEPMLAKLSTELPVGDNFLYEPKWDGFRAIVFRGGQDVFIQSRDLRPLDRYFPELHAVFLAGLPDGCVIDGEIVIATPHGLDFDCLRLHRRSRFASNRRRGLLPRLWRSMLLRQTAWIYAIWGSSNDARTSSGCSPAWSRRFI